MSGGLDSSVAAALLKRTGFDVAGAFMKLIDSPRFRGVEKRARKVAKILKIPFYVFNFEKEFKKRIVDYFLAGNKKGITPNPCVLCNKEIKFGLLLEKALALDADYIATGHYATKYEVKSQNSKVKSYKLLGAKDKNRDQSYFLWKLNQKQLKRVLLPIGDYSEKGVRNLAKKFGLSFLLNVPKSMEICFIPKTVEDFLKLYLKPKRGGLVDIKGSVLGEHQGLPFYTIGQRKGIRLPGGPYYVLDKNLKKNILIVTKNEKDLYKKELIAKNISWIFGKEPKLPFKAMVKIRYRHNPALAMITKNLKSTIYNLKFARPQRAITPGQSAVFYSPAGALVKAGKSNELLGGGIIY